MPSRRLLLRVGIAITSGLAAAYAALELSIAIDGEWVLIERFPDGFEHGRIITPTWGYVAAFAAGTAFAWWWFVRTRGGPREVAWDDPFLVMRPASVTLVAALVVVAACVSAALGVLLVSFLSSWDSGPMDSQERHLLLALFGGAICLGAVAALMLLGGPRNLVVALSGVALLAGLQYDPEPRWAAAGVASWLVLCVLCDLPNWRVWLSRPLFRESRRDLDRFPSPPRA